MQQPLVHVLIINWNGMEHLEACFDSLLAQTYSNVRFVLVDNASSDDSVAFIRSRYGTDPRVEIFECGANLGWSGGNNRGIERALAANADFIFLLNNDTASAPDAISQLVAFAERHLDTGAIAPKMLLFDQPYLLNSVGIACSEIAGAWDLGLGRVDGARWEESRDVLGVCGGAMFLRASCLRKIGLLPEDFEIYLDDLDLCLRVWDGGSTCRYCPDAAVRHKFSATMGQGARARRKYYLNTRNRLRLILRNFPSSKLPATIAKYAMAEFRAVGRALFDREYWKVSAHVRSWCAGVAYLSRATVHRRESRQRGSQIGQFWRHLDHQATFFPGVELPVEGWYAPRRVNGREIRPISLQAHATVNAGRLSVLHANCYSHLGDTRIEVVQNGRVLGELTTQTVDTAEFRVSGGVIEFLSRRVFLAEDTGERFDIGGWIALVNTAE